MSNRFWPHVLAVVVLCALALLVISLHRASGQQVPRATDPVARGRALVEAWCLQCHHVRGAGGSGGLDLDFAAIARMPSTTPMSLRAFLRTPHMQMPNIILKDDDLDDIVAYILSLRRA